MGTTISTEIEGVQIEDFSPATKDIYIGPR
jgi:hypothetical protein